VKAIAAALFGALALLTSGAAAASPQIGFAEDATKYAGDGGAMLFDEMQKLHTTSNRVVVFWNADEPSTIQEQDFLDRMVPVAEAHEIQLVFAIYPEKATQAPTTPAAVDEFCDYAVEVMQRYPYVRKVIIGNEPNQPRFWQPIWNGSTPASPAAMEAVLAGCYDKLKAADPTIDVIAAGLSPRGNDDPHATSNSSISPVRWITALGAAYRASGRMLPLFDEWSWHCYPNRNTDSVETGYAWPNTGCVNAARVKLALWDAFHDTAQPVLAGYEPSTTGSTIYGDVAKMFIDETGWQVDTAGLPGYVDPENVPTLSDDQQAQVYDELVHLADCEPTLTAFHIFHEVDESDRVGFQSGVLRDDFTERASALSPESSVQHAIESDAGACSGGDWQRLGTFLYSTTAVVPDYQTFPYRDPKPYATTVVRGGGRYVVLDAGEGFTYTIVFRGLRRTTLRGAAPRRGAAVKVPPGAVAAAVTLRAETNPIRVSRATLRLRVRR